MTATTLVMDGGDHPDMKSSMGWGGCPRWWSGNRIQHRPEKSPNDDIAGTCGVFSRERHCGWQQDLVWTCHRQRDEEGGHSSVADGRLDWPDDGAKGDGV